MKQKKLWLQIAIALSLGTAYSANAAFICDNDNLVAINAIQSTGGNSPHLGESVYVKGVITALDLEYDKSAKSDYVKGFYVESQSPDDNQQTSDGIYVYANKISLADASALQTGYSVCLQGEVDENFGNTQIDISQDITKYKVGDDVGLPNAVDLNIGTDETLPQAMERYEGMKVKLTASSDMRVTRNFSFDYSSFRNNMVLSHLAALQKPTQLYVPESAEAKALEAKNKQNQLYVDTDKKPANGENPFMPSFGPEIAYIRTGDTVTNMEGVISYSFGKYRIAPTNIILAGDLIRNNDRITPPKLANSGDIRVASFNVLNFFNNVMPDADPNPTGQNRGAITEDEFELQRTKIVNALTSMNADVVGLVEIENNGFGENSAIKNLLDALNDDIKDTSAHYQFIATKGNGPIGNDAISVGLLYRPSKVKPVGDVMDIKMPAQAFSYMGQKKGQEPESITVGKSQRDSLLQKFEVVAKGNLNEGSEFSVAVSHFKSKGSQCKEDFDEYNSPIPLTSSGKIDKSAVHKEGYVDDLQGSCNNFRVAAATTLGSYINENVTGDVLLLGDLNAYGQEDPIKVLTDYDSSVQGARTIMAAGNTTLNNKPLYSTPTKITKNYGFTDLNSKLHGKGVFSYSYEGELGTLDYALANESFASKVVSVEDWHTNSLESNLFEYPSKYTGDLAKSENAFSSSDHDPIIVALNFPKTTKHHRSSGALSLDWLLLLTLLGFKRKR
ncbi:endonuclease [Shewanella sp. OPT22]|nr:endonuclease [Shewanella sp. OPT22]